MSKHNKIDSWLEEISVLKYKNDKTKTFIFLENRKTLTALINHF